MASDGDLREAPTPLEVTINERVASVKNEVEESKQLNAMLQLDKTEGELSNRGALVNSPKKQGR